MPRKNLTGLRIGRWTVIEFASVSKSGSCIWKCKCDCGCVVNVPGYNLKRYRSSGCSSCKNITHGHSLNHNPSREYISWRRMIQRCEYTKDKDYHYYGGRGVTVCERWRNSFINFLSDMGPRPENLTLERINTNGNYTPDNCKWATHSEQRLNQRRMICPES